MKLYSYLIQGLCSLKKALRPAHKRILVNLLIVSYRKDEVCISVLLSDYAGIFFQSFKDKLIDNARFLMILVFLIWIACKEIDEGFFAMLGITKIEQDISIIVFTKQKGNVGIR